MIKNQKETKFNFIDVIITVSILFIVGIVVFAALSNSGVSNVKKTISVEYTVRMEGVKKEHLNYIHEGDTVIDSRTGIEIGKITSIRQPENTKYYGNGTVSGAEGEARIVVSEFEDFYDLYVTISSPAVIGENNVAYIDSNRILVGAPIYFRVSPFANIGYIVDFEMMTNG